MKHPNSYGEREIAKVTVEKIKDRLNLSEEDFEILVLRFGYEWYYEEIGKFVGRKYRDKEYSEGTIRHRVRGIIDKLEEILENLS